MGNKLTKNLLLSVLAQVISLATSFILGFIVPKFVDGYQYAYWQIFVLYIGYSAILHFGVLDGLMLRYSKFDYEQLDKTRIRSQFQVLLLVNLVICAIAWLVAPLMFNDEYITIVRLLFIGILIRNIFTYTSYLLQITNRIKQYASIVMFQRLMYAVSIIVFIAMGCNNFLYLCLADILGDVFAIVLGSKYNKNLYFGKTLSLTENLKETRINISSGILLLISNMSSGLIIGSAKLLTQWKWDELVFGKVSFGFSLFSIFLSFIIAISVVLFPTLKRLNVDELPFLYFKIRNTISPLLFIVLLVYFPMCMIIKAWLPYYSESLVYLGIILPIILFTSKISLLTNNYLKVYRKEKIMLVINLLSVVISFALCGLSAYIFDSIDMLMFFLVAICIARSIVSEIVVLRIINKSCNVEFIVEIIVAMIFVLATRYLDLGMGMAVYFVTMVIYMVIYKERLNLIFQTVKKMIKR